MRIKFLTSITALALALTLPSQAQEKGLFRRSPKIKPNSTTTKESYNPNFSVIEPKKRAEDDFEAESTKMRFNATFEAAKELNTAIAEDTSKIDQGEIQVVEVVDSIQVGDDWVQMADYYQIWDSHTIDPYNLNPREFEETIQLKLFDKTKGQGWNLPTAQTRITSVFGPRWGRWHEGMDLDCETGDPIYSTFDGIVRVVAWDGNGYGRFVMVRHYNGLETLYGHLSKQLVEPGQLVKAGDLLGLGGNTGRSFGSHLHYENRYEGNAFSPVHVWNFPEQKIISDRFVLTPHVWDYLRGGRSVNSEFESSKSRMKRSILHRVRAGETLESIANRYKMPLADLVSRNHLNETARLRVGQKLRLK